MPKLFMVDICGILCFNAEASPLVSQLNNVMMDDNKF